MAAIYEGDDAWTDEVEMEEVEGLIDEDSTEEWEEWDDEFWAKLEHMLRSQSRSQSTVRVGNSDVDLEQLQQLRERSNQKKRKLAEAGEEGVRKKKCDVQLFNSRQEPVSHSPSCPAGSVNQQASHVRSHVPWRPF